MKMKNNTGAVSAGTPWQGQKSFSGLVFDLDGTLIDSVPSLTRALNTLFAEDGLTPLDPAEVQAMVGEGAGLLVARAFAARDAGDASGHDPRHARRLKQFLALYSADPFTGTTLYSGAREMLETLKARGLTLGLCTNKPEAPARALLAHLGLAPFLDAIVGGDTLPTRKPDPAPLFETLRRMGIAPAEALFVGDSATDVRCARHAGVPVAVFTHGYALDPHHSLGADVVLETCPALLDWLEDTPDRAAGA
ncbi:phosphoglycolate phosphatase [Phaeovibrio sulfidiphilus]|uniref:Phosphoglycolate phosphatase n=1 Tax=Phaeovibrio sulfidiphilus TaxID=1220600 RepID=A0A8J6YLP3_9PROT|nr:phosphoglycolate phosphatase [Phaeovibrio sulfidiphilus]MBE1237060.1 phosphoglycolate phosphatase [Phaeovibrio sulfidiphilus]